ncbi:GPI anchor biosynthesis mannsytransferase [Spraguea lophii 42_110]|uniref:Mannosyltransferase n=1 Tax=Spraguea lophii (strain 42_110) TaxID=1358809 RepID=S7XLP7_SPRLO|nr:GPI anchor biosynthesis mannsytransferase [Spraguea lophii 42_110]
MRNYLSSNRSLLLFLCTYRILNVILTETIFEPDEIWQNIEPINYFLFGHGVLLWDWLTGIRTVVGLIFYIPNFILYHLLLKNRIYYDLFSFYLPRIISGLICVISNYYTIRLGELYHKDRNDMIFRVIISHGIWLYGTRTHTDTLIMNLGVIIFYFFKKYLIQIQSRNKKTENGNMEGSFLIPSALAFLLLSYIFYLRPPSIVLLIPILLEIIIYYFNNSYVDLIKFLSTSILYAITFLSSFIVIDSLFVGKIFSSTIFFIMVNIIYGISELFGTSPFYFTILFFTVLVGIQILEFIFKMNRNIVVSSSAILYLLVYSIVGHKEMRFLLPAIPFVLIVCAENKKIKVGNKNKRATKYKRNITKYLSIKNIIRFILIIQYLVSVFINVTHQRVMPTLRYLKENTSPNDSIFFCVCPYSFPVYSYLTLHKDLKMLTGEQDIFSKMNDIKVLDKYKGQNIIVGEYKKFKENLPKSLEQYTSYDCMVINKTFYNQSRSILRNYKVVEIFRYAYVMAEDDKDIFLYVIKKIK